MLQKWEGVRGNDAVISRQDAGVIQERKYRGVSVQFIRHLRAGTDTWLTLGRLQALKIVERVKGIEPSLSAWEAGVMPLYDTRSERLTLYQMCAGI